MRSDVIRTLDCSPGTEKLLEGSLASFVFKMLPEGRVENVHQAGVRLAGEVDEVHQGEQQQHHGQDGLEDVQDGDGDTLGLIHIMGGLYLAGDDEMNVKKNTQKIKVKARSVCGSRQP